jgi:hypothetical protein
MTPKGLSEAELGVVSGDLMIAGGDTVATSLSVSSPPRLDLSTDQAFNYRVLYTTSSAILSSSKYSPKKSARLSYPNPKST